MRACVCPKMDLFTSKAASTPNSPSHRPLCAESTRLTEEQVQDQAVKEGEAFAKAAT